MERVAGSRSDEDAQPAGDVLAAAVAPYLAASKRPRHLVLLVSVQTFVGLAAWWASSSILFGIAVAVMMALIPVLFLIRLVSQSR